MSVALVVLIYGGILIVEGLLVLACLPADLAQGDGDLPEADWRAVA